MTRLPCSAAPALALALLLAGCAPTVPPASAAQRARVRVVMYTTTWCPVCARARRWLHDRGIPFTEHDVERDRRASVAFRQLSPSGVVPVIDVEGEVFEGFVADELRRAIDRRAHAR